MEETEGWQLLVPASYDLIWTAVVVLVVVTVAVVVVRLLRGPRRQRSDVLRRDTSG